MLKTFLILGLLIISPVATAATAVPNCLVTPTKVEADFNGLNKKDPTFTYDKLELGQKETIALIELLKAHTGPPSFDLTQVASSVLYKGSKAKTGFFVFDKNGCHLSYIIAPTKVFAQIFQDA